MWGGVAVLGGEHGEERVQNILQELDELLATRPHDPTQDIWDPAGHNIFKFSPPKFEFPAKLVSEVPSPATFQVSRHNSNISHSIAVMDGTDGVDF